MSRLFYVIIFFLIVKSQGFAGCVVGKEHCSNLKIKRIYIRATGNISFKVDSTQFNKLWKVCRTSISDGYITMTKDHASYKETFALLLSSAQNGLPIHFKVVKDVTKRCKLAYVYQDY